VQAPSLARKLSLPEDLIAARLEPVLLVLFTLLYFSDVLLRASEKFFWYDELFTIYFSRLPTFSSLWKVLNEGIDFNPPAFYLVTRACNYILGEGNVATRLPEILAFWVFSLCVFAFVKRRAGAVAGFAAMLLPMLTGAYFYAYEARPHALVLSATGLALLCWQKALETEIPKRGWLIAFSGSLLGAFMMHCFALTLLGPFSLLEFLHVLRRQRVRWNVWIALLSPALLALALYLPLLRSYQKLSSGTTFSRISAAGWTQIFHYYVFLLEPCILVVLACLLVFAGCNVLSGNEINERFSSFSPAVQDLITGFALATLPVFGVILGKVISGPFFSRYFLSAVAGVCIVLGIGAGMRVGRKWLAPLVALIMLIGVAINLARLLQKRVHGEGEWLIEPSSQYHVNTTPGQPLAQHELLTTDSNLPIAVLNALDFIYLIYYAPELNARLYFVAPSRSEFTYVGFQRFLRCCKLIFNEPATYQQFAQANPAYLAYGDPSNFDQITLLGQMGLHIESVKVKGGHFLAKLGKGKRTLENRISRDGR
jgi:dolichyl-phosphate-mannose-protein mannosyltransferase